MPDLSVTLAGVKLKNPILPASGTLETVDTPMLAGDLSQLGALVNKTVTRDRRDGNPPPRVWETAAGMLNSVGIPSIGIDEFMKGGLPRLRARNDRIIVSIAGFSVREFVELAETVAAAGLADFIELNLSCPNLESGVLWSTDSGLLAEVVGGVRRAVNVPLIAKLSPNVTDIAEMAAVAESAGADALGLVNTFRGLAIDVRVKKPALGNTTGGLSGPAVKPLALYAVWSSYRRVRIPIVGMGGICSWRDAIEFMLAGATAVAVGMYNFVEPGCMWEIRDGIDRYLAENGFNGAKDIIGLAHRNQ
ncbi:MAG: dihydroorotate dehydrogenase [Spirochaetales bacterium]|nr:dihydroorotate dehydrogenase [Spirochaetales bacterium]